MKKQIIILSSAVVISLVMGYSINNIAISKAQPEYKIATVDIQKIVANSTEIKSLKAEQEKQMQNMQSTIDKARTEISKEQDPVKIAQLEEKYRNENNKPCIGVVDAASNERVGNLVSEITLEDNVLYYLKPYSSGIW